MLKTYTQSLVLLTSSQQLTTRVPGGTHGWFFGEKVLPFVRSCSNRHAPYDHTSCTAFGRARVPWDSTFHIPHLRVASHVAHCLFLRSLWYSFYDKRTVKRKGTTPITSYLLLYSGALMGCHFSKSQGLDCPLSYRLSTRFRIKNTDALSLKNGRPPCNLSPTN